MSNRKINIINLTLTPQKKDIIDDIKKRILLPSHCCYRPNSVKTMSKLIQSYFNRIINENSYKLDCLSGIYIDYPTSSLIGQIIQLNYT